MSFSNFIHLHNHSHYSLGDAICQIPDLFKLADHHKMNALAITDHGNMFGIAEFFLEALQYPHINPIVGCEIYLTPHDLSSRQTIPNMPNYHHFLLLVKNEQGYKNLSKMISIGYTQGFYYKPRIDFKTLEQHSEGLIASSACLGGEIPSLLLRGNYQEAKKKALYFQELFGKDQFFLEIMNHGIKEEAIVAEEMLKLSKDTNIPLVATNDIHYPHPEDWESHDIFLCVGNGKKKSDEKRYRYPSKEFYFKSSEEMFNLFESISVEALENTAFIAKQCHYRPEIGKFHIPSFDTPNKESESSYLKLLCHKSLQEKYPASDKNASERLDYELNIIEKMGFASYFLIVQDFINYAKNNHIAVGPGRGSAAGSIVSYLLGITDLDPLKYNLLFERFLNPGRVSMPDIDTDFDDEKRDKVIEYVTEKYGVERVAQIITFGRMKSKLVIRDVARVLNIPLQDADTLAKMVPSFTSLETAYKEINDFKSMIDSSENMKELYRHCLRLENIVRHTSVHAAGIIIGKTNLHNIVPLYKDNKTGIITTQFEGKYLEEFGLLKMDFLGLRNLRVIQDTIQQLKNKDIIVNFQNISLNDSLTYEIFQKGQGIGVFQCESQGIQKLMKKLSPSTFEDIIALIALYRPGPLNSGMTETFIQNKSAQSISQVYQDENIQTILKETYGVMVYQEQIMQISQQIAGFSLAEADNLRKAMGKKKASIMLDMSKSFVQGAHQKGYQIEFAESLFSDMAKFAEYGFNKSHSAAYALIAFQTAYLKAHYPLEYMCALLNAENSSIENLQIYLQECKLMNIDILAPDINESSLNFKVHDNHIRFGFSAIKNIGDTAIQKLIQNRNEHGHFNCLMDIVERISLSKKIWEGLCLAGALDSMIPNRASFLNALDSVIQLQTNHKKDKESGMNDLFASESQNTYQLHIPIISEMDLADLLIKEKEITGSYLSGHPLVEYEQTIHKIQASTTQDLQNMKDSMTANSSQQYKKVKIIGLLNNTEIKLTKKNDKMAICTLEDLQSEISVILFPKTYEIYENILNNIKVIDPVIIEGRLELNRNTLQVSVSELQLLSDYTAQTTESKIENSSHAEQSHTSDTEHTESSKGNINIPKKHLCIYLSQTIEKSNIDELKDILIQHSGTVRVNLVYNEEFFELSKQFSITDNNQIVQQFINCLPYIKEIQYR